MRTVAGDQIVVLFAFAFLDRPQEINLAQEISELFRCPRVVHVLTVALVLRRSLIVIRQALPNTSDHRSDSMAVTHPAR